MIIGEERPEKKMQENKTSRDPSTLGGQDKRKTDNKSIGLTGSRGGLTGTTGLTGTKTGLTGACRESGSFSRNKTRPSFKELLAKYEKQEVIQKKEKRSDEAKDVSLSLKLQEQWFVVHIKIIVMGRLLPGFILIFIRLWIIVG